MATSTIPALKGNLVALLKARTGLTGVQVSYGPPLPNPSREFIWCGKATGEQAWMTVAKTKSEEYELEIVILVLREGADMQAADERCFALFAELENALRADTTVSGAVADATVAGFELGEFATDSSREASLTVQVACKAWI
jgi:hypothetical protein